MNEEIDFLLTKIEGDVLVLNMLFNALVDVIRQRGVLADSEIAEIFNSVLISAEARSEGDLGEMARKSVERLMRS